MVDLPVLDPSDVAETKGHAQKLKHSEGSDDGCLLNILWSHWNLIITLLEIKLRENCRT